MLRCSGEFPDIDAGISAMMGVERVIDPEPADVARYGELMDRYTRLYPALKRWREESRIAGAPR